ncbi:MAG: glutathione S-transferase N-terminal domain-containing protein [Mangrovibacterium sp.]
MKLYMFDHCPHCQLANMVAEYKGIQIEKVYLQNHDTASRKRMANSSTVPILEKPDGSYMAESLDIAHYFDHLSDMRIILPPSQEDKVNQWIEKADFYYRRLTFPRTTLLQLPEFESPRIHQLVHQKQRGDDWHDFRRSHGTHCGMESGNG